ncbi:MAG: hypothetical protein IJJ23_01330 [Clostridia bacterium]|nr:hypothetical protein [Clostridia bacterium]
MLERYLETLLFELRGADDFLMAIPAEAREDWEALPPGTRTRLRQSADAWLEKEVPPLNASDYISYSRAGIAAAYQKNWQARRQMLGELVLGACVTDDSRYDMKLCDVIWAICEESSWVLPQNNPLNRGREGQPLPDVRSHRVDEGAAHTAANLALAVHMLAGRLSGISDQLERRIADEIQARVVEPFLEAQEFNWICGPKAEAMTCLCGCLLGALTFVRDDRRRWACARKGMELFDALMTALPRDGSVPGGLDFWPGTAQFLTDIVMILFSASGGAVDMRRERQVRLLCHYPVFCHVAEGYFVNPGQHSMKADLNAALCYRVGAYVGDDALCDLGAFLARRTGRRVASREGEWLLHRAADLFNAEALESETGRPPFRRQGYYAQAQILVARGEEDSEKGLAVALHGGHNGDVGAHPDVGDFVLFCGGEPVLIDAGYLGDTEFHNLPTVEGAGQKLGAVYRAADASCQLEDAYALVSLNLAPAYPEDLGISGWQRSLILEREDGSLRLIEVYDLQSPKRIEFNFITPYEPGLGANYCQLGPVRMRWDNGLSAVCDTISVPEDQRPLWGENLYRIVFSADGPVSEGRQTFTFNALRTFGS